MKKMIIALSMIVTLIFLIVCFVNLKRFGRFPRGERLARIEQSPNYKDGQFVNQNVAKMSMKEAMHTIKTKVQTRPTEPMPVVKTDLRALDRAENCIVWFGHSSYFIQVDSLRILVDPVFCSASPVSFVNKPFVGTKVYTPENMPDIDLLIITHDHWDHLDYKTVMALKDRIAQIVCPLGVGEHFDYWGFKNKLTELDWYEQANVSHIEVHCRPSMHFSGRGLTRNKSLWASFVLQTPTRTFYVGGDGGYGQHFAEVGRDFPNIDYAFIENGQYNEAWSGIHTMPEFLETIIDELQAKHYITVHHSKYALARHAWNEPLHNAEKLHEQHASVLLPMIGEKVELQ